MPSVVFSVCFANIPAANLHTPLYQTANHLQHGTSRIHHPLHNRRQASDPKTHLQPEQSRPIRPRARLRHHPLRNHHTAYRRRRNLRLPHRRVRLPLPTLATPKPILTPPPTQIHRPSLSKQTPRVLRPSRPFNPFLPSPRHSVPPTPHPHLRDLRVLLPPLHHFTPRPLHPHRRLGLPAFHPHGGAGRMARVQRRMRGGGARDVSADAGHGPE